MASPSPRGHHPQERSRVPPTRGSHQASLPNTDTHAHPHAHQAQAWPRWGAQREPRMRAPRAHPGHCIPRGPDAHPVLQATPVRPAPGQPWTGPASATTAQGPLALGLRGAPPHQTETWTGGGGTARASALQEGLHNLLPGLLQILNAHGHHNGPAPSAAGRGAGYCPKWGPGARGPACLYHRCCVCVTPAATRPGICPSKAQPG